MNTRKTRGPAVQALAMLTVAGAVTVACSSATADDPGVAPTTHAPESAHASVTAPASVDDGQMRVTLLGTGSPVPSITEMGSSILVQAGGQNLVFDAGRGSTIRLEQAQVPMGRIDGVFLTHFHSDHVNGLPDLWLTGFLKGFGGRDRPLDVYGPTGTEQLVDGLTRAFANDVEVRIADGDGDRDSAAIIGHDFADDGVVYDRDGVRVTMFTVQHDPAGIIEPAVGYRVDYHGRSAVFSGDTVPVENMIVYGDDVDLLVHEVAVFDDPSQLQNVMDHHTSPQEAGEIFAVTAPRLAVYSHIVNGVPGHVPGVSTDELVRRTRQNYDGPLVVGADLDTFLLTDEGVDVGSIDAES